MARGKATIKGVSVLKLYLMAVACFIVSRLFEGRIEVLNYAFAVIGFALFLLAFLKYYKSRKR